MLCKSLCVKCYNETRKTPWEKQPAKERQWKRGKVCCWIDWSFERTLKWRKIHLPPPDQCPYYLEHILQASVPEKKSLFMSKHIGMLGERREFKITVLKATLKDTEYGPACDHTMITPEGDILFWEASNHGTFLTEGQQYCVKATISMHDRDDNRQLRTVLKRVSSYLEPERTPKVAIGYAQSHSKSCKRK